MICVAKLLHLNWVKWVNKTLVTRAACSIQGVGNVTNAMKELGIYDDTMIVFVSDNGGHTHNNERMP